jgi:hypothetical protein
MPRRRARIRVRADRGFFALRNVSSLDTLILDMRQGLT